MRIIFGLLFILTVGFGCSGSNSSSPGAGLVEGIDTKSPKKIFAVFVVSGSWEEGSGIAQARLRKEDINGEVIDIGFFHTDNQLFCNGDLFAKGSVHHPDLWLFGSYDYSTGCLLKNGSKEFKIVLNMTEPGYEGIYVSTISLPKRVEAEPIPFTEDNPMTTADEFTVKWKPQEDPVELVFEVLEWAPVYEKQIYFDKIEQSLAVDPGAFVIKPEYFKDFPLNSSSKGRMNIYRKKIGQFDPKLKGEAYGYSWSRGKAFPLKK